MADTPTAETPIPGLEIPLPDYHGRKPTGMKTRLQGAGNRISTPHEIGSTVVLLVEAKVKSAGHDETDDGLLYEEVYKCRDVFEVPGDPGRRLLSTFRQAYRLGDDTASGRRALVGDGLDLETAGVTDANGVLLTAAELADLRGDPVRAALDVRTTPAVIVFSDGARNLWPDEFDQGEPRPSAGDRFEPEEGAEGAADWTYVAEVLHAETGETLERWTDEQETARLAGLEQKAERAETVTERARGEIEDKEANPVAYYRVEHEDGSLSEVDEVPEVLNPGDVVIAVHADGLEEFFAQRMDEALDTGDPTSTDYDDGLDPLVDEVRFVEDDEGYADVVPGNFPEEPTGEDYAFVDRGLDEIAEFLPAVATLAEAKRILEAEKRGRGRSLKTRKGAVDLIVRRIAELEKAPADG